MKLQDTAAHAIIAKLPDTRQQKRQTDLLLCIIMPSPYCVTACCTIHTGTGAMVYVTLTFTASLLSIIQKFSGIVGAYGAELLFLQIALWWQHQPPALLLLHPAKGDLLYSLRWIACLST